MSNFFNLENPLFTVLSKICDLILVSMAYIVLCIPIVTIGPASTALYYAVVKAIRRERGYVFREFFRSFRLNFKRALIIGVVLTIIFFILGYDLIYAYGLAKPESTKGSLLMGVFIGIEFLTVSFSIYVYPILSRFDMTLKHLIKATVFMSMRHLHFTIVMIVVNALAVVISYFFFPFILIAPAGVMYVNSFMMEKVLKKYMPESEGPPEETGKDEWYLE